MLIACVSMLMTQFIGEHMGANSQNFLRQICKIFVTFGRKILQFLRLNVDFKSR